MNFLSDLQDHRSLLLSEKKTLIDNLMSDEIKQAIGEIETEFSGKIDATIVDIK